MKLAILCPFMLLFTLAFGSAAPVRDQCEGDNQCFTGYYCFQETGYCAPCTDCEVYNRNPSWRTCAKSPNECGSCLSGFDEEILAGGQTRFWCIKSVPPNQVSAHHAPPVQNSSSFFTWPLGIAFFIILTLFYAACWKNNWRGVSLNHRLSSQAEEPPPYSSLYLPSGTNDISSSSSSSADNEGPSCSCNHNGNSSRPAETSNPRQLSLNWQQPKEEHLQQAVPFRYPDYSSNPLIDSDDESNVSEHENFAEEAAGGLSQERNIELEDETTMPSDWRPYPIHNTANQEEAHGCDDIDAGNAESVSEPPAKKRKEEDETALSPETPSSSETADE